MAKDIGVISYNLDESASMTQEATAIRDALRRHGYSAKLVDQKSLRETSSADFKSEAEWEKYDGIVIAHCYYYWNLRELIRSGRPILCANIGYFDDLGLGEYPLEETDEDEFICDDDTHDITSKAGLSLGPFAAGSTVRAGGILTHDHHVDVLVSNHSGHGVLLAHKTHPIVGFGWYRMSQAVSRSSLYDLLVQSANWAFSGP